MNACERYETDLSAWLDDELDRAEQIELLDHLARCSTCRDFTIQARSLEGLVATVRPPRGDIEPSPEVWTKIQESARQEPVAAPPAHEWSALWRAAAVLILAAGLGLLMTAVPESADRGDSDVQVRLGENAEGMDDSRFMELTTEVLRADPRYHTALYRVMEQVVRDSGARETTAEYFVADDDGEEPILTEITNRNPA